MVAALLALFFGTDAFAQSAGDTKDVFVPIAKYIRSGDADRLSAWFDDNLEVTIFSSTNDASRNQARQIVKSFFNTYSPRSFQINHTASRPNMKYAYGTLTAGGERLSVTIFVSCKDGKSYYIQQLKFEKRN
jgi:hypothetical protein